MSRRRESGSSLDLLLDTICNTFGGVVFIAILVVVLLQMTATPQADAPPDEAQQEELAALEERRSETEARLKSLREAAAQQEAIIEQLVNADDQAMVEDMAALQARRAELDQQRLETLGEVSAAQIKTNEAATKLESLKNAQDARKKIAALEAALKSEVARRTQTARSPVQRSTKKASFPVLLHAGRWHSVYVVRANGTTDLNTAECTITTSAQGKDVRPTPGTGIAIEDNDASRNALTQRLNELDSHDDYVSVFVWADSFGQFRLVKDLLVNRGFEYRLVPMAPSAYLLIGGSSSLPALVQ